jgi:hypothetical protein
MSLTFEPEFTTAKLASHQQNKRDGYDAQRQQLLPIHAAKITRNACRATNVLILPSNGS